MKNTCLSVILSALALIFVVGFFAQKHVDNTTSMSSIPQPLLDITLTQSALDQTATYLAPYPTLESTATVSAYVECAGSGIRCRGQDIRNLNGTATELHKEALSIIATLTAIPDVPQPLLDLTVTQAVLNQTATHYAQYPIPEPSVTFYIYDCGGSCLGQDIREFNAENARFQYQATFVMQTLTAEAHASATP